MGCGSSKEAQSSDFANRYPPSDPPTRGNQFTSDRQVTKSYTIQIPPLRLRDGDAHKDPPPYETIAQNRSDELILEVLQQGLNLQSRDAINAFDSCKHRRLRIWIDDNPALKAQTRSAIQLFTLFLFLIGKGTTCDMEFCWMSRSNLASDQIGATDRETAEALNQLMKTQNWETACNMIKTETKLEKLELREWLSSQMGHNAGSQRHSSAKATNPSLHGESAREKHNRLLVHARKLMTPYFAGWELKEVDMNKLVQLDKEAVKEAKKQTNLRNNISRTLIKEIEAYKRETEREGEGTPTTVIPLVGSHILEAEKKSVIECQRSTGFTSKLSRKTVTGDMFSIQTVAFTEFMPEASVKLLQAIDNAFDGDHDINDLTMVDEKSLLEYGPAAKLFEKVLNSHLRRVDGLKLATKDMYGKEKSCTNDGTINFPHIEEVERIFGKGDEDSDDGSGNAICVPAED